MRRRRRGKELCRLVCVLALSLAACGEDLEFAPNDCVRSKPDTGTLKVRCTISEAYPEVPVTVYLGDFEEDQVMLRDTVEIPITLYELPVDEYYSVTAEYAGEGDTLVVLRGDEISTSSTEYEDATCWSVNGAEVDCRKP